MSELVRNSHCAWCGAAFEAKAWPRTCAACRKISYLNPIPVAVLIVPFVGGGVLGIRRALAGAGHGRIALPGGFVNYGESWQEAAVRELREEAQVEIP